MTGRRFSIGDYETAARRRLPACVWEFLSGGVEDNVSRDRNAAAFERWALVPRTLVDVSSVDASVEVFGQRFNAPIGMPPTGVTAIYRPRCDALLAKSFHDAGLPYVISGASTVPLEELAKQKTTLSKKQKKRMKKEEAVAKVKSKRASLNPLMKSMIRKC